MLTLLLGPDDFSKSEYIAELTKKARAEVVTYSDADVLPDAENLTQGDLFSTPKVFVLKNLVKHFTSEYVVNKLLASKNQIVISEQKLDKRLAENKQLLANKQIQVKEFNLPHGRELDVWIGERVKFYGTSISPQAIESLSISLGRDNGKETKFGGKIVDVQEVFDLWQAGNEIKKLVAFVGQREINTNDITELSTKNSDVDVFDLTNAIADNKKDQALDLLHRFLGLQTGSDEKGAVIQLNGLLSEQFRNVAMLQSFMQTKKPEDEILELTGWKSGRLFVLKKIAGKFPPKKVMDFLSKLVALDAELKSSNTPPKVLLDLIMTQLFI